jgi:hypothetical protein
LISSHPHFDHIGGIRSYNHIGATVVMHYSNVDFMNHDILTYTPRTMKPDILSLWPPTEVAEGYNYEAVQENYVITDNTRILRVYYVQPLAHVSGMLMAYLPAERIAFGSKPVRHARAAHRSAEAGDDELLEPGETHESQRVDDCACARPSRALVRFREGDGRCGKALRNRRRRRCGCLGTL